MAELIDAYHILYGDKYHSHIPDSTMRDYINKVATEKFAEEHYQEWADQ